jgi:hypothetical protein
MGNPTPKTRGNLAVRQTSGGFKTSEGQLVGKGSQITGSSNQLAGWQGNERLVIDGKVFVKHDSQLQRILILQQFFELECAAELLKQGQWCSCEDF